MYAEIKDGQIVSVGNLPDCARRFDTAEWVCPPDGIWSVAEREACGYFAVVEAPRPPDTATDTSDATYSLVDGVPTQVWVTRAKTPEEVLAATQSANDTEIGSKIQTVDLPAMQAILDATNATINGGPAPYLKDVAKAVRRLDRKVTRLLDGTT